MLAPSHSTSGAPCLAQSPRSVAIFQGMLKCSGTPPIFIVGSTTWDCRLQGADDTDRPHSERHGHSATSGLAVSAFGMCGLGSA